MDDVRKAFAAANKVDAGLFSFNFKGACANCQGAGVIYADLAFLQDVALPCEVCHGKRFKDEVLAYHLNGKSIVDVLDMTVRQAWNFYAYGGQDENASAERRGAGLFDAGAAAEHAVGRGMPAHQVGERTAQGRERYVLDEPTTGLHMSDITHLLEILNRLVEGGNTVIVIEHNLDVIASADWIIDMGPEGGTRAAG